MDQQCVFWKQDINSNSRGFPEKDNKVSGEKDGRVRIKQETSLGMLRDSFLNNFNSVQMSMMLFLL